MREAHSLEVANVVARSVGALSLLCAAALVGCGGGAGEAPPANVPEATPSGGAGAEAKPAKDPAADKAAAVEKLTAEEAKSGQCDAAHKQALEKLALEVETAMKAKTGEDGKPLAFQVVGKRVLALGSDPRGVELTVTGKGTELHVLAYGVNEISMDVLAGTTAATTLRSPFHKTATSTPLSLDVPNVGTVTEIQGDSRQVVIKPGQPLEVKMTGQGCAAMISFLKP